LSSSSASWIEPVLVANLFGIIKAIYVLSQYTGLPKLFNMETGTPPDPNKGIT
jgi:hypothetical protein